MTAATPWSRIELAAGRKLFERIGVSTAAEWVATESLFLAVMDAVEGGDVGTWVGVVPVSILDR